MLAITTTTINKPTNALLKFIDLSQVIDNCIVVIAGDLKTPHKDYEELEKKYKNVFYLSPELQEKKYKELSDAIGFNCIQRRNFAYIYAFEAGADIIYTCDDDNIPNNYWANEIFVNKYANAKIYDSRADVFDPLSITNNRQLWHRGYPIQLLSRKNIVFRKGTKERKILVQADLWNGNPDVDAICRIAMRPEVIFEETGLYTSDKIMPFNSQNTFLSRKVFPEYFLYPFIGRMDDIFAAYHLQHVFPGSVAFYNATVYQQRNEHNLVTDLKNELIGYENALNVALHDVYNYIPKESIQAHEIYKKYFI